MVLRIAWESNDNSTTEKVTTHEIMSILNAEIVEMNQESALARSIRWYKLDTKVKSLSNITETSEFSFSGKPYFYWNR